MKEKLINNLGLKILSIFLAFFVWLIVMNVSNPEVTRTKEVPLEIENEQVLTAARKTYNLLSKNTVTVSYDVRARDEYKIRAADFRAYIDLAELYDVTGSIPVKIEVVNNKEILSNIFAKSGTARVETEDLQRKRFDLQVVDSGKEEDGYQVGEYNLNPLYVYVDGPTSLVGQISYVGIPLDLTGRTSETPENKGNAMPVFYDANGSELDLGERVTTNVAGTGVDYEIVIHRVKTLNLDFEVFGNVASGYRYTGLDSDIKMVSVQGMTTNLATLNKITIPGDVLSLEGATSNRRVTIDLQQYLPEGVEIVGSSGVAEVLLKVEKLETRKFTLDATTMIMQGANSEYQYVPVPEKIELTVQGLKEELKTLTLGDIGATLNVSGYEPGKLYQGRLTFNQSNVFEVAAVTEFNVLTALAGEDVDTETTEATAPIDPLAESEAPETEGSLEAGADVAPTDKETTGTEETTASGS